LAAAVCIADGLVCRCVIRTTQLLLPCVHRVLLGRWSGNMERGLKFLNVDCTCVYILTWQRKTG